MLTVELWPKKEPDFPEGICPPCAYKTIKKIVGAGKWVGETGIVNGRKKR